jgi:hypothetical protein
MMGFGDARFGDDFAGVDVPRRQIRQFVHACEASLQTNTTIRSINFPIFSFHSMATLLESKINLLEINLIDSNDRIGDNQFLKKIIRFNVEFNYLISLNGNAVKINK